MTRQFVSSVSAGEFADLLTKTICRRNEEWKDYYDHVSDTV
ncbi:MAG: hypothetical protein ACWGQW_02500 [bacterium]